MTQNDTYSVESILQVLVVNPFSSHPYRIIEPSAIISVGENLIKYVVDCALGESNVKNNNTDDDIHNNHDVEKSIFHASQHCISLIQTYTYTGILVAVSVSSLYVGCQKNLFLSSPSPTLAISQTNKPSIDNTLKLITDGIARGYASLSSDGALDDKIDVNNNSLRPIKNTSGEDELHQCQHYINKRNITLSYFVLSSLMSRAFLIDALSAPVNDYINHVTTGALHNTLSSSIINSLRIHSFAYKMQKDEPTQREEPTSTTDLFSPISSSAAASSSSSLVNSQKNKANDNKNNFRSSKDISSVNKKENMHSSLSTFTSALSPPATSLGIHTTNKGDDTRGKQSTTEVHARKNIVKSNAKKTSKDVFLNVTLTTPDDEEDFLEEEMGEKDSVTKWVKQKLPGCVSLGRKESIIGLPERGREGSLTAMKGSDSSTQRANVTTPQAALEMKPRSWDEFIWITIPFSLESQQHRQQAEMNDDDSDAAASHSVEGNVGFSKGQNAFEENTLVKFFRKNLISMLRPRRVAVVYRSPIATGYKDCGLWLSPSNSKQQPHQQKDSALASLSCTTKDGYFLHPIMFYYNLLMFLLRDGLESLHTLDDGKSISSIDTCILSDIYCHAYGLDNKPENAFLVISPLLDALKLMLKTMLDTAVTDTSNKNWRKKIQAIKDVENLTTRTFLCPSQISSATEGSSSVLSSSFFLLPFVLPLEVRLALYIELHTSIDIALSKVVSPTKPTSTTTTTSSSSGPFLPSCSSNHLRYEHVFHSVRFWSNYSSRLMLFASQGCSETCLMNNISPGQTDNIITSNNAYLLPVGQRFFKIRFPVPKSIIEYNKNRVQISGMNKNSSAGQVSTTKPRTVGFPFDSTPSPVAGVVKTMLEDTLSSGNLNVFLKKMNENSELTVPSFENFFSPEYQMTVPLQSFATETIALTSSSCTVDVTRNSTSSLATGGASNSSSRVPIPPFAKTFILLYLSELLHSKQYDECYRIILYLLIGKGMGDAEGTPHPSTGQGRSLLPFSLRGLTEGSNNRLPDGEGSGEEEGMSFPYVDHFNVFLFPTVAQYSGLSGRLSTSNSSTYNKSERGNVIVLLGDTTVSGMGVVSCVKDGFVRLPEGGYLAEANSYVHSFVEAMQSNVRLGGCFKETESNNPDDLSDHGMNQQSQKINEGDTFFTPIYSFQAQLLLVLKREVIDSILFLAQNHRPSAQGTINDYDCHSDSYGEFNDLKNDKNNDQVTYIHSILNNTYKNILDLLPLLQLAQSYLAVGVVGEPLELFLKKSIATTNGNNFNHVNLNTTTTHDTGGGLSSGKHLSINATAPQDLFNSNFFTVAATVSGMDILCEFIIVLTALVRVEGHLNLFGIASIGSEGEIKQRKRPSLLSFQPTWRWSTIATEILATVLLPCMRCCGRVTTILQNGDARGGGVTTMPGSVATTGTVVGRINSSLLMNSGPYSILHDALLTLTVALEEPYRCIVDGELDHNDPRYYRLLLSSRDSSTFDHHVFQILVTCSCLWSREQHSQSIIDHQFLKKMPAFVDEELIMTSPKFQTFRVPEKYQRSVTTNIHHTSSCQLPTESSLCFLRQQQFLSSSFVSLVNATSIWSYPHEYILTMELSALLSFVMRRVTSANNLRYAQLLRATVLSSQPQLFIAKLLDQIVAVSTKSAADTVYSREVVDGDACADGGGKELRESKETTESPVSPSGGSDGGKQQHQQMQHQQQDISNVMGIINTYAMLLQGASVFVLRMFVMAVLCKLKSISDNCTADRGKMYGAELKINVMTALLGCVWAQNLDVFEWSGVMWMVKKLVTQRTGEGVLDLQWWNHNINNNNLFQTTLKMNNDERLLWARPVHSSQGWGSIPFTSCACLILKFIERGLRPSFIHNEELDLQFLSDPVALFQHIQKRRRGSLSSAEYANCNDILLSLEMLRSLVQNVLGVNFECNDSVSLDQLMMQVGVSQSGCSWGHCGRTKYLRKKELPETQSTITNARTMDCSLKIELNTAEKEDLICTNNEENNGDITDHHCSYFSSVNGLSCAQYYTSRAAESSLFSWRKEDSLLGNFTIFKQIFTLYRHLHELRTEHDSGGGGSGVPSKEMQDVVKEIVKCQGELDVRLAMNKVRGQSGVVLNQQQCTESTREIRRNDNNKDHDDFSHKESKIIQSHLDLISYSYPVSSSSPLSQYQFRNSLNTALNSPISLNSSLLFTQSEHNYHISSSQVVSAPPLSANTNLQSLNASVTRSLPVTIGAAILSHLLRWQSQVFRLYGDNCTADVNTVLELSGKHYNYMTELAMIFCNLMMMTESSGQETSEWRTINKDENERIPPKQQEQSLQSMALTRCLSVVSATPILPHMRAWFLGKYGNNSLPLSSFYSIPHPFLLPEDFSLLNGKRGSASPIFSFPLLIASVISALWKVGSCAIHHHGDELTDRNLDVFYNHEGYIHALNRVYEYICTALIHGAVASGFDVEDGGGSTWGMSMITAASSTSTAAASGLCAMMSNNASFLPAATTTKAKSLWEKNLQTWVQSVLGQKNRRKENEETEMERNTSLSTKMPLDNPVLAVLKRTTEKHQLEDKVRRNDLLAGAQSALLNTLSGDQKRQLLSLSQSVLKASFVPLAALSMTYDNELASELQRLEEGMGKDIDVQGAIFRQRYNIEVANHFLEKYKNEDANIENLEESLSNYPLFLINKRRNNVDLYSLVEKHNKILPEYKRILILLLRQKDSILTAARDHAERYTTAVSSTSGLSDVFKISTLSQLVEALYNIIMDTSLLVDRGAKQCKDYNNKNVEHERSSIGMNYVENSSTFIDICHHVFFTRTLLSQLDAMILGVVFEHLYARCLCSDVPNDNEGSQTITATIAASPIVGQRSFLNDNSIYHFTNFDTLRKDLTIKHQLWRLRSFLLTLVTMCVQSTPVACTIAEARRISVLLQRLLTIVARITSIINSKQKKDTESGINWTGKKREIEDGMGTQKSLILRDIRMLNNNRDASEEKCDKTSTTTSTFERIIDHLEKSKYSLTRTSNDLRETIQKKEKRDIKRPREETARDGGTLDIMTKLENRYQQLSLDEELFQDISNNAALGITEIYLTQFFLEVLLSCAPRSSSYDRKAPIPSFESISRSALILLDKIHTPAPEIDLKKGEIMARFDSLAFTIEASSISTSTLLAGANHVNDTMRPETVERGVTDDSTDCTAQSVTEIMSFYRNLTGDEGVGSKNDGLSGSLFPTHPFVVSLITDVVGLFAVASSSNFALATGLKKHLSKKQK